MESLGWVEIGVFGAGLLMSTIGVLILFIVNRMNNAIDRMSSNVEILTVNSAVAKETLKVHDRRIGQLESKEQYANG